MKQTKQQTTTTRRHSRVVGNIADSTVFFRHKGPNGFLLEFPDIPAGNDPVFGGGCQVLGVVWIPRQRFAIGRRLDVLLLLVWIPGIHKGHRPVVRTGRQQRPLAGMPFDRLDLVPVMRQRSHGGVFGNVPQLDRSVGRTTRQHLTVYPTPRK